MYRVLSEFPKIRDLVCIYVEYDSAYRWRFQDTLSNLNKGEFLKNPVKEITRLLDLLISRENEVSEDVGSIKNKWKMIKSFLKIAYWYLKIFDRKLLKKICQIVSNINLEEIKLSVEDIYWANKNQSYNSRGLSWEARQEEYNKVKNN
jgi:hypothetical protein